MTERITMEDIAEKLGLPKDQVTTLSIINELTREALKWGYIPAWHMTQDGRGMVAYPRPKPAPAASTLPARLDALMHEYGIEGEVKAVEVCQEDAWVYIATTDPKRTYTLVLDAD